MTIDISIPEMTEFRPKITVFGVGGAGGNAVNNMIKLKLQGVSFVVANTDAQALENSLASEVITLGGESTKGLGAGASPKIGEAAAEESQDEIVKYLEDCNMVFITAGMGGGTGTGAAPVIARLARERQILTVGVVTKPFNFEGAQRMRLAESGIEQLHMYVDTLIVIPNQNLFRIANEKTTLDNAFVMADNVLYAGVRGVTDLILMPGLINLDFADIRTVMCEMGKAMMGTGEGKGDNRAKEASEAAISNPLLDNISMKGASGVLINITGGSDMTLFEVDEAANRIRDEVDSDANIIFGSTFDPNLEGTLRVSVIATGIESKTEKKKVSVNGNSSDSEAMSREGSNTVTQDSAQYTSSEKKSIVASSKSYGISANNTRNTKKKKKGLFASLFQRGGNEELATEEVDKNLAVMGGFNRIDRGTDKVLVSSEGDSDDDDNLFDVPAFLRKKDK